MTLRNNSTCCPHCSKVYRRRVDKINHQQVCILGPKLRRSESSESVTQTEEIQGHIALPDPEHPSTLSLSASDPEPTGISLQDNDGIDEDYYSSDSQSSISENGQDDSDSEDDAQPEDLGIYIVDGDPDPPARSSHLCHVCSAKLLCTY